MRDSVALATNAQLEELRTALAEQMAFEEDANREAEAVRAQLAAERATTARLERELAAAAPREAELLQTIHELKEQAKANDMVRATYKELLQCCVCWDGAMWGNVYAIEHACRALPNNVAAGLRRSWVSSSNASRTRRPRRRCAAARAPRAPALAALYQRAQ